jgi:hypothetical protein
MFFNMVTLNSRSWRLILTLLERASVALFLLMRQITKMADKGRLSIEQRKNANNSVVLY